MSAQTYEELQALVDQLTEANALLRTEVTNLQQQIKYVHEWADMLDRPEPTRHDNENRMED